MIYALPPEQAWEVRQYLDHFASRSLGRWHGDGLEQDVRGGLRQVYVAVEDDRMLAVMMTRVDPENVFVDAVTGRERERWIADFEAHMTEWARATGRKRVIALARPGWAREARELGYREAHREFVREVQ